MRMLTALALIMSTQVYAEDFVYTNSERMRDYIDAYPARAQAREELRRTQRESMQQSQNSNQGSGYYDDQEYRSNRYYNDGYSKNSNNQTVNNYYGSYYDGSNNQVSNTRRYDNNQSYRQKRNHQGYQGQSNHNYGYNNPSMEMVQRMMPPIVIKLGK